MNASSAPDRLAELQRRFLDGLKRRVADMAALLGGAADPKALMPMYHSLAGIAGTFGYPQITEISRRCEELCLVAIAEVRPLVPLETECLIAALESIRAAAPASPSTSC